MRREAGWEVLVSEDCGDELRLVAAHEDEGGSVMVEERTDGELTLLTYGALTCVRRVTVAPDALEAAAWALGPDSGELLEALRVFFDGEERYLSDVQDVLDAGGVPYSYAVACGNNFALRRLGA